MLTFLLGAFLLLIGFALAADSTKYVKIHYETPYEMLFYSDFLTNVSISGEHQLDVQMLLSLDSSTLWTLNSNTKCFFNGSDSACGDTFGSVEILAFNNSNSYEDGNYVSNDGFKNLGSWETFDIDLVDDSLYLANFSLGAVKYTNITGPEPYGVLAVGFDSESHESSNLLSHLKDNGKIDRRVVSFIHENLTENTGYALFGAVDQAKYVGDLQSLPMINSSAVPSTTNLTTGQYQIKLDSLALNSTKGEKVISNQNYPVVFTTNLDFVYLPPAVFENLAIAMGANISFANFIFDCPKYDYSINLVFDFSGVEIGIPLTSFLFSYVEKKCNLGITVHEEGDFIVLGRSFLKSAYVAFDMDLREVLLAPRYFTTDELIGVADKDSGTPNVTPALSYSLTAITTVQEVEVTGKPIKYDKA